MKLKKLTDRDVRSLKPQGDRYDVFDESFKGGGSFGIRVTPTGRKSFVFIYRGESGRQRRATLGSYPALSLAEARKMATEIAASLVLGEDSTEEREEGRVPTFEEVFAEYIDRHAKPHKRSWEWDERVGRRDIFPHWKLRPITEIRKRDVIELLDEINDRGAGILANRVRSLLSKVFNFAIDRDIVDFNPVSAVRKPSKERARDRVLQNDEIRKVWAAVGKAPLLTGSIYKLMLLTGQRGKEVRSIRWSDIDTETNVWTIPAEVSKNGRASRVPLSTQAQAVLDELRRVTGNCKNVFPGRNNKEESMKDRSKYAKIIRQESGVEFRPHDLRRTVATYMEDDLDIPRTIVDRVLNHVDSSVTGKHYSRGDKLVQTREALQRWADHLDKITKEDEKAD